MGDGQRHADFWDLLANPVWHCWKVSCLLKSSSRIILPKYNKNKTKKQRRKRRKGREKRKRKGEVDAAWGPASEADWDFHMYATHKCTYTSGCHMHLYMCVLPPPQHTKNKTFKKKPISFTTKAMSNETQSYLVGKTGPWGLSVRY